MKNISPLNNSVTININNIVSTKAHFKSLVAVKSTKRIKFFYIWIIY